MGPQTLFDLQIGKYCSHCAAAFYIFTPFSVSCSSEHEQIIGATPIESILCTLRAFVKFQHGEGVQTQRLAQKISRCSIKSLLAEAGKALLHFSSNWYGPDLIHTDPIFSSFTSPTVYHGNVVLAVMFLLRFEKFIYFVRYLRFPDLQLKNATIYYYNSNAWIHSCTMFQSRNVIFFVYITAVLNHSWVTPPFFSAQSYLKASLHILFQRSHK